MLFVLVHLLNCFIEEQAGSIKVGHLNYYY